MSYETDNMEKIFSLWEKETEIINKKTKQNSVALINRKQSFLYKNIIFQESFALVIGIAVLCVYFTQWNKIFSNIDSPKISYIITLLIGIIAIIDSFVILITVLRIDVISNTPIEVAKKTIKLLLLQKIDLLIALLIIMPISLFSLVPITIWCITDVNIFLEWNDYKYIYLISIIAIIITGILMCVYIYRKNIKYIKTLFSEWSLITIRS